MHNALASHITSLLSIEGSITLKQQFGGDINSAFALISKDNTYFIKYNSATLYPAMFVKEGFALEAMQKATSLTVPHLMLEGEFNDLSFLVLEWIQQAPRNPSFDAKLAIGLAELHKNSATSFGFFHDNYIGTLPQLNNREEDWVTFFITQRLEPLVRVVRDKQLLTRSDVTAFTSLFSKLPNLFPEERPALLHGDLWSGNVMANKDGLPVLFDPACYYGHREMDIAMMTLFGGFSTQFYNEYNNCFPLEKRWEERIALCNLYPLLVHLALFGISYLSEIQTTLRKF